MDKSINVTKSDLPDKKELFEKFNEIYKNNQLTNNGPLCKQLEQLLKKRFNVKNVILVANGTLALQLAIRVLVKNKKNIITSPYSFIATTSSILWEGCKPIFADIDKETFNINPKKILNKLNNQANIILPVHVYGNPCDIESLNKIKKSSNSKIIYDASHAFDIKYNKRSIFNYGDISTVSFHATKIFHTVEGGAIFTNNNLIAKRIRRMINFGYEDYQIKEIGINAKMSEFHAAMGICLLKDMKKIIKKRKKIFNIYFNELKNNYLFQKWNSHSNNNYAYAPILFESHSNMKKTLNKLNQKNIFPRRYFYPSLDTLSFTKNIKNSISENISSRILCLPIYSSISNQSLNKIINIIKEKT